MTQREALIPSLSVFLYCYGAMLLVQRNSLLKLSSFAVLITLCLVFTFNYEIEGPSNAKGVTVTAAPTSTPSPSPPPPSLSAQTSPAIAVPAKIWYKLGSKDLNDETRGWIDNCLKKNPTFQSEFMTDISGDSYVKENFALRPDIVETYLAFPIPIFKADLLRYLLLFAEGGIWNDLDVTCKDTPMQDWIPEEYKKDANLVLGWEFDVGWGDNFERQFASWTMMAKPRSPHISMIIDDILDGVRETTEQYKVKVADLTLEMTGDVVDFTGPRRLTRSVFKSLTRMLNDTVDHRNASELMEPKLIGDVLILPGYAFAASSNHYAANQSGTPLVTHHFAGTWKNEYGGETA